MSEIEEQFANWISQGRQERGWTQNELARRAGLSSSHMSYVLSGARPITWDFCAAIAKAFGLPATEVFRKAGLLAERTEVAEQLADVVSDLSPADQRALLRHARGLAQLPEKIE